MLLRTLFLLVMGVRAIGAQPLLPPDPAKWTVINHVAWNYAHDICFDPAHVGIDAHGWLELRTEVLASTCYNYALNGSISGGPYTSTYTSGMLQTNTFSFQYGTVETRVKFSGGQGTWPAAWMISTNCQVTYPYTFDDISTCLITGVGYGEIDIAEVLHSHPVTEVNQRVYRGGGTDGCFAQPNPSDVSANWHIYKMIWTAGQMIFTIDGIETCRSNAYPLSQPLCLLFDIMLDHGTGGTVNPATLPQTMYVDYVKVTQGNTVIFEDDFDYGPVGYNSQVNNATITGNAKIQ